MEDSMYELPPYLKFVINEDNKLQHMQLLRVQLENIATMKTQIRKLILYYRNNSIQLHNYFSSSQTALKLHTIERTKNVLRIKNAINKYKRAFDKLEKVYQKHIKLLALDFQSILQAELLHLTGEHMRDKIKSLNEQLELKKCHHELCLFAHHVSIESTGQVQINALQESSTNYKRCIIAAKENIVKERLWNRMTNSYNQIQVTKVYRMKNTILLESFDTFVKNTDGFDRHQIKGLFCEVHCKSIEHVAVYGMHPNEKSFYNAAKKYSQVFNRLTTNLPMSTSWIAKEKVVNSTAVPFPRRFSRYSTLMEHACNLPSKPYYLLLCRVALGKVDQVQNGKTEEANQFSPEFSADKKIGALHFSDDDEYLIRYPESVVPEYLIECQQVPGLNEGQNGLLSQESVRACHPDSFLSEIQTLFPGCIDVSIEKSIIPTRNTGNRVHDNNESIRKHYLQQRQILILEVRLLTSIFWKIAQNLWEKFHVHIVNAIDDQNKSTE